MSEKVVGYILLVVGLVVIVFAVVNVFMTFTGKAMPVQLFNFQGVTLDFGQQLGLPKTTAAPMELISARDLNQMANLTAQILLMGFLAGAGEKLASLGVSLIRPIVVKAKES